MKKALISVLLAIFALSGVVYAQDGAIEAWRRNSSGTLTSGVDSNGNIVTPDIAITDDLTLTGSLIFDGGANITGNQTNGTSRYWLLLDSYGSIAQAVTKRFDILHLGTETNAVSTNLPMVGAYISVGRPLNKNAESNWESGTFDTALRTTSINKSTNNAAYGLRGAYIKTKNYSTGTVGGLEGLFIECVADGTDDSGEAIILKLGTDSSTIDYGIDLDQATCGTADLRLQGGGLISNPNTNTITFTELQVAVVGNQTVSGTLTVTGAITGPISAANLTATGDVVMTKTLTLGSLAGYLFGTAGVIDTTLNGGSWTNLDGANIQDGTVGSAAIDPTIVTNVLATGMVLPAVDVSACTNGNAGTLLYSGNMEIARATNLLASAGPYVLGNVPIASITNALKTGGATIGGNIPIAALTNALSGITTNFDITDGATWTQSLWFANGVLTNHTYSP